MKNQRNLLFSVIGYICRTALAITFLFSGYVKAIDPLGMNYKLQAYMQHFGIAIAPESLWMSIAVVALASIEFLLGIQILLGIQRRLSTRAALAFMSIMTLITLYIFIADPVADCGCFGDALKLTNGQTLLKNILLLLATIVLLLHPEAMHRLISTRHEWITSTFSAIYIISLALYSYHYLPLIDFTAYKQGINLTKAIEGELGEEAQKELAATAFWNAKGDDVTYDILLDTGYTFLLTSSNLNDADDGISDRINDLHDYTTDKAYTFYGVTTEPGSDESIHNWTDRSGAAYEFIFADAEQLKAMVRSNPGLLLLKNGQILKKWSKNNLPETDNDKIDLTALYSESTASASSGLAKLLEWFFIPLIFFIFADNLWIGSKYYKRYRHRRKLKNHKTKNLKTNNHMRKKIVAGNWKMNKNLQEGVALAKELNELLTADKPNCGVIICTPFIHLATVSQEIDHNVLALGAENCADKASGAFTGEVSAEMVKSTGAEYVILGHSERRAYYGETAEMLKEKVNLALENGLKVIFCIGELLEERKSGKQNDVVRAQIEGSLFDLTAEQFANIVLAYEPVWAIGTGETATAEQAEDMHAFIRNVVAQKFGSQVAEDTTILYGGSCKPSNAKELFAKPDVDGGLIGGASLKAADFKGIIDAWK